MTIAININGGLGRCVCALPALYKSNSLVITNGWEELYALTDLNCIESNSSLIGQMLENVDVISPEPYHQAGYRKGDYSMVEAFHKDIGTQAEVGEEFYGLYPDPPTNHDMWRKIQEAGAEGKPIVAIQVIASGPGNVRNLNESTTKNAIEACRELGLFPVIVGDENIGFETDCVIARGTSLTEYISLIAISDMFIGGDSSGMHIARALNKRGIIYFTSTSGTKYYPDWFHEFRHPDFLDTYEYPRLFAAEHRQTKRNARIGVNNYTISKDNFLEVIEKIRD